MDRHNPNTTHEGTQDRGVPRGDHVVDPAHEGGASAGTDGGAPGDAGKSADAGTNAVSDGLGDEVGPATAIEEK
jgi:hypothetical protein